jgi:hypothetical protein
LRAVGFVNRVLTYPTSRLQLRRNDAKCLALDRLGARANAFRQRIDSPEGWGGLRQLFAQTASRSWRYSAMPLGLYHVVFGECPRELVVEEPHRAEDFAEAGKRFRLVCLAEGEDAIVAQISQSPFCSQKPTWKWLVISILLLRRH